MRLGIEPNLPRLDELLYHAVARHGLDLAKHPLLKPGLVTQENLQAAINEWVAIEPLPSTIFDEFCDSRFLKEGKDGMMTQFSIEDGHAAWKELVMSDADYGRAVFQKMSWWGNDDVEAKRDGFARGFDYDVKRPICKPGEERLVLPVLCNGHFSNNSVSSEIGEGAVLVGQDTISGRTVGTELMHRELSDQIQFYKSTSEEALLQRRPPAHALLRTRSWYVYISITYARFTMHMRHGTQRRTRMLRMHLCIGLRLRHLRAILWRLTVRRLSRKITAGCAGGRHL